MEHVKRIYNSALGQSILLFLYLFLIIASYVVGKVSRDALFLDQFQAVQLPYVDIAVAALVGFAVAAYVKLGRKIRLDKLLIVSLAGYAGSAIAFWGIGTHYKVAWLYPVVYVWIGLFGVLATAQVWTLANYVFTAREAKNSFGIVGSGAIAGWIVGGYLCKVLAGRVGTESLLLVMAAALILCIALVMLIWEGRRVQDEPDAISGDRKVVAPSKKIVELWSIPHLRAIAILICLSSFATTTASWQFKAITKEAIPSTPDLAAFFGEFNFYAGILSLCVQLAFTSRFLKRFGIGPALLVVPIALLLGSAGTLVFGTLSAVILLKGFDQVFRYSLDKSSVELLYLPIPLEVKMQAKSLIDTVVWRIGDGLAGVGVLLATRLFHASPKSVGWISIGVVGLWVAVALVARRTYVASLREIVQPWRSSLACSDSGNIGVFSNHVASSEIAFASEEALLRALASDDIDEARRAIFHAARSQDISLIAKIADRLLDRQLQSAAQGALVEFGDSAVELLAERLADCSQSIAARVAVADVLGKMGTVAAKWALEANLLDPVSQVRHQVAAALQFILRTQPGLESHRTHVAAALALEIGNHYHSYHVLQQMNDAVSEPARPVELQCAMNMEAERIFCLLSVLHPDDDLESTYAAIISGVPAIRDSALELLENTLDVQLRKLLLPLFDDTLSNGKRAQIAAELLGEEAIESKQIVWRLVRDKDSWNRSGEMIAAEAIAVR